LSHDVPIGVTQVTLAQLNERSREIFRQIVESYLATGEPVGSRNLARLMMTLSPASVRNVMSDLEQLGLILLRIPRPAGCPPSWACASLSTR
jgi:heat-inducible transcriptional repressor